MRTVVCILILTSSIASGQSVIKARSSEGTYEIRKPDSLNRLETGVRRFALVIGNKNYKQAPLVNSENDANDMTEMLKLQGFEVDKVIDATKLEMQNAIRKFGENIRQGGVGLFYYSGHGTQVDGENFLIPIDANYEMKQEVTKQCVGVSIVLNAMERINSDNLNIMILDACRNNTFKSFDRSANQGMTAVDAPKGSIVAYSTAPGRTASDGAGRNGLYTSKLIKYMSIPGMKIEEIFKSVRIEVMKESNERQVPWESNSLMGDFYFSKN